MSRMNVDQQSYALVSRTTQALELLCERSNLSAASQY